MMARNKYGAKKTRVGDKVFASKAEALQYVMLKQWERDRKISGLECQRSYPLCVGPVKVATYVADFAFIEKGKEVALEVKGFATAVWKLKKKMFEAQYRNIELRIVKA